MREKTRYDKIEKDLRENDPSKILFILFILSKKLRLSSYKLRNELGNKRVIASITFHFRIAIYSASYST